MTEEERLRAELARVEGILESTNRALRQATEELEQFAYVASHDLQEPLRMVSNYVTVLAEDYQDAFDSTGRQYMDFAVDGVKRMRHLLDALLEWSRAGRGATRLSHCVTGDILDDAIVRLERLILETGAVITKDPLPPVLGDADMLVHLFQNLLSNAVKFAKEGVPPRINITASERDSQGYVTFAISDNGVGFEMAYADKIFHPYQRLRRDREGTGIGLAICKKVVDRHQGEIWAETAPGQGSTFYVKLRSSDEPPARTAPTPESPPSGGQSRGCGVGSASDSSSGPSGSATSRVRWSRSSSVPPPPSTIRGYSFTEPDTARLELTTNLWARAAGGSQIR